MGGQVLILNDEEADVPVVPTTQIVAAPSPGPIASETTPSRTTRADHPRAFLTLDDLRACLS